LKRIEPKHLPAVLDGLGGQLVIVNTFVPFLKQDRQLPSGKVGAKASVWPTAEGDVTGDTAIEVDPTCQAAQPASPPRTRSEIVQTHQPAELRPISASAAAWTTG
jgi:hypothetical protein